MIKKIVKNKPGNNTLKRWLYTEPLKFTVLFMGLTAVMILIGFMLGKLFNPILTFTIIPLVLIAFVFSTYMLIKWLPKDDMDRKSYISISNTEILIYSTCLILFIPVIAIFLLLFQTKTMFYTVTIPVLSIISFYQFGLIVSINYASYKRALVMGVSRRKALWSIPFGTAFYFFPGYLFESKTKEKETIVIKLNWIKQLTNWIVKKPSNAIFVALSSHFISSILLLSPVIFILNLFLWLFFGIWVLISGKEKLRKNINGAYAIFIIIFNALSCIVLIASFTFFLYISTANKTINTQQKTVISTVIQSDLNQ